MTHQIWVTHLGEYTYRRNRESEGNLKHESVDVPTAEE
jgi:hypothetical protein